MHIHTPLGLLPEVLELVTRFLSLDDRKTCACVCQAWHAFFQPTVWEHFHTHKRHGSQPAQVQDALSKNGQWIKHLRHCSARIPMEIHQTLSEKCRSLATLEVQVLDDQEWSLYRTLIQQNKGLVDAELGGGHDSKAFILHERQLHKLVQDLPLLRRLALSFETTVMVSTLERVLAACPLLNELVLLGSIQLPSDAELSDAQDDNDDFFVAPNTTYRLRGITARECKDPAMLQIVERCPSLQDLTVGALPVFAWERLCHLIRSGRFLHLCELGAGAWGFKGGLVLDAAQACRLVRVHIAGTDEEMKILVASQHQTLEVLTLEGRLGGRPGMLQEVLASCHRLKRLQVFSHKLLSILPLLSKPWVCRGLEVLDIGLGLEPLVDESRLPLETAALIQKERDEEGQGTRLQPRTINELVEMAFWRRLGEFQHLRKLDSPGPLRRRNVEYGLVRYLTWSLDNGLGRLAGLGRMQHLGLGPVPPIQLGIAELQFMKTHWPRLEMITVVELHSPEIEQWLSEHWPDLRLVNHDPRYRRPFQWNRADLL